MVSPRGRPRGLLSDLAHLLGETTLVPVGAVATTVRAVGAGRLVAGAGMADVPSACTDGDGQALDDAVGGPLARTLAREHAVVGREVAADHVGLHGGAFIGQFFRLERDVGAVLAVVDSHLAVMAAAAAERFVMGIRPLTALTEACVWTLALARMVLSVFGTGLVDVREGRWSLTRQVGDVEHGSHSTVL